MTPELVSVTLYDKTNTPGQGGIPPLSDFDVPEISRLDSMWGNVDFAFSIEMEFVDSETSDPVIPIGITLNTAPTYITSSNVDPVSPRLSLVENPFDEKYFYVDFEDDPLGVIVESKPEYASLDYSIVKWQNPTTKIINGSYVFDVVHANGEFQTTLTQDVYWSLELSLQTFVNQVNRSRW